MKRCYKEIFDNIFELVQEFPDKRWIFPEKSEQEYEYTNMNNIYGVTYINSNCIIVYFDNGKSIIESNSQNISKIMDYINKHLC